MSKETPSQAPLEINWCRQTDPPCPYEGRDCGIVRHLRHYSGERRRVEAKRLVDLAEEDPDGFWRTCAKALWPE